MPQRKRRYRRVLVWMRRAWRVQDNAALWHGSRDGDEILPVVFLRDGSRYAADSPRRRYLRSALADVDARLRGLDSALFVVPGTPEDALLKAAMDAGVDAVYAVRVYDPRSLERDRLLGQQLATAGIAFHTFKDAVIFEKDEVRTASDGPYKVFTPYKRAWLARLQEAPPPFPPLRGLRSPAVDSPFAVLHGMKGFSGIAKGGGESAARERLKRFVHGAMSSYRQARDIPAIDGTSRLSPDLANGTISIRTVVHAVREAFNDAEKKAREGADAFLGELIWREFYYQILGHFPFVVDGAFKKEFDGIRWSESRQRFAAWCEGRTGYPIVDAAMRQLHAEGWMHNRTRMIVASFLTKDLHLNWQWGERHFLDHLVDADIASNNGGWQWAAGTGTDASPYFRIFNPVKQGQKFDPRGVYVRRYLPELREVPDAAIHSPWEQSAEEQRHHRCIIGRDYPAPVVDHRTEREVTMQLYNASRGRS